MTPDQVILGIDPGLNITGFGVIAIRRGTIHFVDGGCIRPRASDSLPERLRQLHEGLAGIIREHRPRVAVLEEVYSHYRHPRTAVLMAHARGVICLAAAEAEVPLVSYAATRVKKAVTGNGRASKLQVQDMVGRYLGLPLPIDPVDISDALGLALAHRFITEWA